MPPRHNTLDLSVAHHGTTRVTLEIKKKEKKDEVIFTGGPFPSRDRHMSHDLYYYLTGVLPSLQIASTDHVLSDLERICIKACVIAQERGLQALQLMRVPRWKRQK